MSEATESTEAALLDPVPRATSWSAADAPCAAAGALYEQYGPALLRFCISRLRSREEAEDAVQSTFLRACAALQRGVRPRAEAAWLFKIAHNVCMSQRLAAARRGRVEQARDVHSLQDEVAAPQAAGDELFRLNAVLAEMPERLRTAFLLREWQGLSYQEIAEHLGTTHAAVETLIFRGRRHLARALAATGPKRGCAQRAAALAA